tara:strand:+ start:725 stop:1198 length:474 start_codon:yes stop_codon:yes gene_type:complete
MSEHKISIRDIVVEDERDVQRFMRAAEIELTKLGADDPARRFSGSTTMLAGDIRRHATGHGNLRKHGAALIAHNVSETVLGVLLFDKCPVKRRPSGKIICLLFLNDEDGAAARKLLIEHMRTVVSQHGFTEILVEDGIYQPVASWPKPAAIQKTDAT